LIRERSVVLVRSGDACSGCVERDLREFLRDEAVVGAGRMEIKKISDELW
jgi:hypothetical protein